MNEKPSAKATILEHGLKPKKSFGQNFMVDQRVNSMFARAALSLGPAPVVEIGAGTGSLTRHLLEHAPLVHAIERDRDLVPILNRDFSAEIEKGALIIHEADGARFDLESIASSPIILVGNLPYHLTSSIMLLALKNYQHLKGAVFLIQKEVADRLLNLPNNKDYGFMTVVLNLAFALSRVVNVDKSAFWPVPKVDSAIIKLETRDRGISQIKDIEKLIVFVREIFQKRRKKLSTILTGKISKDELEALNIDPNARPEQLSHQQFLAMYLASVGTN